MPGATPRFAIPYPCLGDAINATAFSAWTTGIESAMAQVDAAETLALHRPAASMTFPNATSLPVGVATNITYGTELFDTDNMIDLGSNNDRITIRTGGLYMVEASVCLSQGPLTTYTSGRNGVSVNGTVVFARKHDDISVASSISGILPAILVPGDILRHVYLWTGTGGPGALACQFARLSARLVCPSP
jgi:hypothetical protein